MSKKKDKKQKSAAPAAVVPFDFPTRTRGEWAVILGAAFLVNFILYLFTLAPTVTFEDSGELIAAAYNLGIPHEPGYPLFTLLGHLFSMLPFGGIAWRVNLMSAFFTAAAGMMVCRATILLIEHTFTGSRFIGSVSVRTISMVASCAGISSAILFGTAKSTWEQAIITEVYGINSFLVGLFIVLALHLKRSADVHRKQKTVLLMSYICGLALANHTTSLMLIPLLGICLFIYERKMLSDWRLLATAASLFTFGLTLYLYLPAASMKNPAVDWGDPDTITNFIRVVTRHQYQFGMQQSFATFTGQFAFFCSELLVRQWVLPVVFIALAGLIVLLVKNRAAFYFTLAILLFTMPVTTWMTNFPISNPAARAENGALVSVFYIPGYLTAAILAGICLFGAAVLIGRKNRHVLLTIACLFVVAATGSALVKTLPEVSMHRSTHAWDYCENVSAAVPENALYFVNWDPFCFPLIYYQFVEKKRPDLIVIDQQLLRRSWYIRWLQRYYPEFMQRAEREVGAFLDAATPFEAGKPYDGNNIQRCYITMINVMIDAKLNSGNGVYFTYTPEPAIMRSYRLEPQFAAYRYTKEAMDRTISDSGLALTGFTDSTIHCDRMAEYVRNYYGNLYGLRGLQMESIGDAAAARYCFGKARLFFNHGTQQALFVERKLAGEK